MLGIVVFVVFFTFFFSVTLIVPNMPPGQIICSALGNSETSYPVAGISGETLVAGIVNGLIWGVIIIILYSYSSGPQKGKVSLPVWVPGYTQSSSSADEDKPSEQYDGNSLRRVRKTVTEPIESIDGIGPMYGHMLRNVGISNLDDLLVMGATRKGRQYLANKLDVSPTLILEWVNQAETHI